MLISTNYLSFFLHHLLILPHYIKERKKPIFKIYKKNMLHHRTIFNMDFVEAFDERRFSYQKIFLLRFFYIIIFSKCLCCCEYSAQDNVFFLLISLVWSIFIFVGYFIIQNVLLCCLLPYISFSTLYTFCASLAKEFLLLPSQKICTTQLFGRIRYSVTQKMLREGEGEEYEEKKRSKMLKEGTKKFFNPM